MPKRTGPPAQITLLGFGLLALQCSLPDLVGLVDLDVKSPPTFVGGGFFDARSGEPIKNREVSFTVDADAPARVVDMFNEPFDPEPAKGGYLNFGLDRPEKPTRANPLGLRIVARAEGYLPAGASLSLTSGGFTPFALRMVAIKQPPPGVVVATDTTSRTSATGALRGDISVQTARDSVSHSRASLEIPAGTVILDASGEPLRGALTITVAYYTNTSAQALLALPGGVPTRVRQGGEVHPTAMVSGGILDVTIVDAEGREAKRFVPSDANPGAPMAFTMEVPGDTRNPETGDTLQSGDTLPLWSYSVETGEWAEEGSGMVEGPDAAERYLVRSRARHLSAYAGAWICPSCEPHHVVFTPPPREPATVTIDGGPGFLEELRILPGTGELLLRPPCGSPAQLRVTDTCGTLLGSGDLLPSCASEELRVRLSLPDGPLSETTRFELTSVCTPDKLLLRPTMAIWLRPVSACSGEFLPVGAMIDGTIEVSGLAVPGTYELMGDYEGSIGSVVVSFDADRALTLVDSGDAVATEVTANGIKYRIELPPEACTKLAIRAGGGR